MKFSFPYLSHESFLVLFFKKEQHFFCEQSCDSAPDVSCVSAPDGKKQKTSSV